MIDAYGELCDEGCLAVFGPNIGDNTIPMKEAIEERFKVPCISVTGSDAALGEWVFAFQHFRDACKHKGIRIVAEASIAQTAGDVTDAVNALYKANAQAIVHCGFGFGVVLTLLRALADAHPLSPRGVKEALERVKTVPAASGAPGTRISFGNWTRRGWMGAGYIVARRLDADDVNSHLVDRFGAQ